MIPSIGPIPLRSGAPHECIGITSAHRTAPQGRALPIDRPRPFGVTLLLSLLLTLGLLPPPGAAPDLHAQPVLTISRIVNNWPTIEVYFKVDCGGTNTWLTDISQVSVRENGLPVTGASLWCPDATFRCQVSVALVFDASGSMLGAGNQGAIEGGRAFIDLMDGVTDEAAVLWFTSTVTVTQGMTTDKNVLTQAVNSLPAGGATAVWDGIYFGLLEVINNGSGHCRAVIVLTDGGDNSSSRQPAELVALAHRNHIRVCAIGLGGGQSSVLESIATLTGGKYYAVQNPADLSRIYQELSTFVRTGFECMITYRASCPDGAQREVAVSLHGVCNGSDTKTMTYRAPRDTSGSIPLALAIPTVTGSGNSAVRIPVIVSDTLPPSVMHPASFTVLFDSTCMRYQSVSTDGTLLHGVPVTATAVPGGIRIQTQARTVVSGSGPLAELTFIASDPGMRTDTCALRLEGWSFDAGCFAPTLQAGRAIILPARPVLHCTVSAPAALGWSVAARDYDPQPFTIQAAAANTGGREATAVRFRMSYDTTDLVLLTPALPEQDGSPTRIPPSGQSTAVWSVRAQPRSTSDSVRFCITTISDGLPDITCCHAIWIPRVDASLHCTMQIPVIAAVEAEQRYVPMPVVVQVLVRNERTETSDTVRVRLSALPGALRFSAPDSPASIEKITTPARIPPGGTAQVSWTLDHPVTQVQRDHTLAVSVIHRGVEVTACSAQLTIPALLPALSVTIRASGSTTICEGDSVTLDAGAGYASYLWSTGAQGRSIVVRTSGVFTVHVTDTFSRGVTSPPVTVTVLPAPRPRVVVPPGGTLLCPGNFVVLDAGAGYARYRWNDGSTGRMLTVSQGGQWWVVVETAEGCSGVSDTVVTVMLARPPEPVISRAGNVLTSSVTATTYRWYRDGVEIPGATGPSLLVDQLGTYMVVAVNQWGCSSASAPFDITVLGSGSVPVAEAFDVICLPNPVRGEVDITLRGVSAPVTLTVIDPSGRVFRTLTVDPRRGASVRVPLHDAASGVYVVHAAARERSVVRRFMKVE